MKYASFFQQFSFFFILTSILLFSCNKEEKNTFTVSGQIECKVYTPGSTIGGRIIDVFIKEGDTVKRETPLIQFDCAQQESMYQSALAGVKRAESLVEKLKKGQPKRNFGKQKMQLKQQKHNTVFF